MKEENVYLRNR